MHMRIAFIDKSAVATRCKHAIHSSEHCFCILGKALMADAQVQPPLKKRKLSSPAAATQAPQQAANKAAEAPAREASARSGATAWELVQYTEAHELYHEHYRSLPSWERGWKRPCRWA